MVKGQMPSCEKAPQPHSSKKRGARGRVADGGQREGQPHDMHGFDLSAGQQRANAGTLASKFALGRLSRRPVMIGFLLSPLATFELYPVVAEWPVTYHTAWRESTSFPGSRTNRDSPSSIKNGDSRFKEMPCRQDKRGHPCLQGHFCGLDRPKCLCMSFYSIATFTKKDGQREKKENTTTVGQHRLYKHPILYGDSGDHVADGIRRSILFAEKPRYKRRKDAEGKFIVLFPVRVRRRNALYFGYTIGPDTKEKKKRGKKEETRAGTRPSRG